MLEISAAIAAARATMDLLRVSVDARDDAKIRQSTMDLAARLQDMTMAGLSMSERLFAMNAELQEAKSKLRDLEDAQRKREQYVLHEVRPGAFVYAFKPGQGDPTPTHYKCQVCFDAGKDSILVKTLDDSKLTCRIEDAHGLTLRLANNAASFRRGI